MLAEPQERTPVERNREERPGERAVLWKRREVGVHVEGLRFRVNANEPEVEESMQVAPEKETTRFVVLASRCVAVEVRRIEGRCGLWTRECAGVAEASG
jgi:hypothetical protein